MSGLARAAVSEDLLILVDEADREIGTLPKTQCHLGGGSGRGYRDYYRRNILCDFKRRLG